MSSSIMRSAVTATAASRTTALVTAIVLLSGAIFAVDLLIPGDVILPALYVVLVVLTLRLPSQASSVLTGVAGTALTLLGLSWNPPVGEWGPAISNRFLALSALWLNVPLCLLYKHTEQILNAKDQVLDESSERFRQLAEHITEVFWLSDPDKNQILYISPGYEAIWGRSCASLYVHPRSWLEAIHPEDRARVLKAALTKQVGGNLQRGVSDPSARRNPALDLGSCLPSP